MQFAAAEQEITKPEHFGVSVESSVLCEDTIDVDMDAIDFVAQPERFKCQDIES
jgi:hypothetical protein